MEWSCPECGKYCGTERKLICHWCYSCTGFRTNWTAATIEYSMEKTRLSFQQWAIAAKLGAVEEPATCEW